MLPNMATTYTKRWTAELIEDDTGQLTLYVRSWVTATQKAPIRLTRAPSLIEDTLVIHCAVDKTNWEFAHE